MGATRQMTHSPQQPESTTDFDPSGVPVPLWLFAAIAVLMALDVGSDLLGGVGFRHLALEVGIMVAALGGVGFVGSRWAGERRAARTVVARLARVRAEAERWRSESEAHARGLGAAIDAQFERWALTPADGVVALLLLKGLSLKEVAAVRGVTERTAREQARRVYGRAGLSGRAELSAFFLEDLLAPE